MAAPLNAHPQLLVRFCAGVRGGPAVSGVVTFLFTDIEGSTRRWETDADAMRVALAAHDKALRSAIEAHDGLVFSHSGDGMAAAFSPMAAVEAAVDASKSWTYRFEWGSPPAKPNSVTTTTSARS